MGRPSNCPICNNNFLSSEYARLKKDGLKGRAIANLLGVTIEQADYHRKSCLFRRKHKIESSDNKTSTNLKTIIHSIPQFPENTEVKTELEQLEMLREHVQRVMNNNESARDILDCITELRQISAQITKVRSEERNAGLLEGSAFTGESEKLLRALADSKIPEVWDTLCGNRV